MEKNFQKNSALYRKLNVIVDFLGGMHHVLHVWLNTQYLCLDLTLIFACIFSLKPLDVEFMKQLHDKVNIVPVIGKADTLTPTELQSMKRRVIISNNYYYFQCYVLTIILSGFSKKPTVPCPMWFSFNFLMREI